MNDLVCNRVCLESELMDIPEILLLIKIGYQEFITVRHDLEISKYSFNRDLNYL